MSNLRKEFSKIYDRYIDKIYRFIFLKVNSQEIAEDLTSETFLRLWERMNSDGPIRISRGQGPSEGYSDAKIENIQAFLYQIARNLVIDHYREKGQQKTVPVEAVSWRKEMADSGQDLEEKACLRSDLKQVRQALVSLKEDYQEVIIWRYLDDLSIAEIARMLQKSEEAVRVTIHRALKALRAAMPEQQ